MARVYVCDNRRVRAPRRYAAVTRGSARDPTGSITARKDRVFKKLR